MKAANDHTITIEQGPPRFLDDHPDFTGDYVCGLVTDKNKNVVCYVVEHYEDGAYVGTDWLNNTDDAA